MYPDEFLRTPRWPLVFGYLDGHGDSSASCLRSRTGIFVRPDGDLRQDSPCGEYLVIIVALIGHEIEDFFGSGRLMEVSPEKLAS